MLDACNSEKTLNGSLLVTGFHYDKANGYSRDFVVDALDDSTKILEIDPIYGGTVSPEQIAAKILQGLALMDAPDIPDVIVLLGDRFEILPVAYYATIKGIILIHAFGGECDASYCMDTLIRDSITKMAHIHFVSHEDVKQRLINMGEEEWRISVFGNPSLTHDDSTLNRKSIIEFLLLNNIDTKLPLVNVCYHPVTTDREISKKELDELMASLDGYKHYTYIWSGVNNDIGADEIKEKIIDYCTCRDNHFFFDNLGIVNYKSLLCNAAFMIGNSSSGLLEAATYGVKVINIGERQSGRLHGANVIDVCAEKPNICRAIDKIIYETLEYMENPFYMKDWDKLFLSVLKNLKIDKKLKIKRNKVNPNCLSRTPDYF